MDVMTLYYHLSASLVSYISLLFSVTSLFCSNGHGFMTNIYFNRLDYSIPVVITLVTMEASSKELLMKVEDEFRNFVRGFELVVQNMTRFGK